MNRTAAAHERDLDRAQNSYTRHASTTGDVLSAPDTARRAIPGAVSVADWECLTTHVARVLCNGGTLDRGIEQAVQVVVQAMRQAGATWDAIYVALSSSLEPCESPTGPTPLGMERHPSRGAALIAHMHCWADCERLAELEGRA